MTEHQAIMLGLLKEFDRVCKTYHIHYMLFAGSALGAVRHNGFIPWDDDLDVVMLRTEYDRLIALPDSVFSNDVFLQREYSAHWPMHASKLRKNVTTCLEKYHPKDIYAHQGIYIDIFPCDNASDCAILRRMQFFSSKVVIAKSLYARGFDTDSILKKQFMKITRAFPLKPFLQCTRLKREKSSRLVHTFLGGTSRYARGVYPREWFTETIQLPFEDGMFPVSAHYDEMLTTLYGDYMQVPTAEERKCKVHAILVDTEKSYELYTHYRDDMEFDVLTRSIR